MMDLIHRKRRKILWLWMPRFRRRNCKGNPEAEWLFQKKSSAISIRDNPRKSHTSLRTKALNF